MPSPSLAALSRPNGTMSMVAMDQRESLKTMFRNAGISPSMEVICTFKRNVAKILTPYASAFLIDRQYGLDEVIRDELVSKDCAIIAAADSLQQAPDAPVEETDLDPSVVGPGSSLAGIKAIKLLLIWRRDHLRDKRILMAQRFISIARERGVLSVLEPVVRATDEELEDGTWNTEDAIVEAAQELSPLRPDLYKAQVPCGKAGEPDEIYDNCLALDQSLATPWVVLSQGVPLERFPMAVEMACKAGASGFLAGRALWSDVVGSANVPKSLSTVSVPRLKELGAIVDIYARPWQKAVSDKAPSWK